MTLLAIWLYAWGAIYTALMGIGDYRPVREIAVAAVLWPIAIPISLVLNLLDLFRRVDAIGKDRT